MNTRISPRIHSLFTLLVTSSLALLLGHSIIGEEHAQRAIPAPSHGEITVTEGTNLAMTVSPDHKTVVFDLQTTLWSIPFGGGKATRLTDPLLEAARPDYSPKGDRIAFRLTRAGRFTSGRSNRMAPIRGRSRADMAMIANRDFHLMVRRLPSPRIARFREITTFGLWT
jgi:hypothetical protein